MYVANMEHNNDATATATAWKETHEDHGDCISLQAGLARIFCDLHSVRDAVNSGDPTIQSAMQKAAVLQNENLKQAMSVSALQLSDKAGHVGRQLAGLFEEMQSMVPAGRLDSVGTASLSRALNQFIAEEQTIAGSVGGSQVESNATAVFELMTRRAMNLKAVVQASVQRRLSSTSNVEHRVHDYVMQQKKSLGRLKRRLGMFRHTSAVSQQQQQLLMGAAQASLTDVHQQIEQQNSGAVMLNFDTTWWQLRSIFDTFLANSSTLVDSFDHVVNLLEMYTSMCSVSYEEMKQDYDNFIELGEEAKSTLHDAWRKAVPLVELLVSNVVNGKLFVKLARADVQRVDRTTILGGKNPSGRGVLGVNQFCASQPGGSMFEAAKEAIRRALMQDVGHSLWLQSSTQLSTVFSDMAAMQNHFALLGVGRVPQVDKINTAANRVAWSFNESGYSYGRLIDDAVLGMYRRVCT